MVEGGEEQAEDVVGEAEENGGGVFGFVGGRRVVEELGLRLVFDGLEGGRWWTYVLAEGEVFFEGGGEFPLKVVGAGMTF